VREAHSISAGLDYPGVGPEHSFLREQGLATYVTATDEEALAALERLARSEGIIPALETSHAVAEAIRLAPTLPRESTIVVCLSGRGDKDMETVATARGVALRDPAQHGNGGPR
jgi:tryptophan synthase beta chain